MGESIGKTKRFSRMNSRKSQSWWWDSHISPENSKWLADNLEGMDKRIIEMRMLIEGEGDSSVNKAETCYQMLENFYGMYRALAERYDNVTGELRKGVPTVLQSEGSLSEVDFEARSPSPSPEPNPEHTPRYQKQRSNAAAFTVSVHSGGSSDLSGKGSDGSLSSSDSELEFADEKPGNGGDISYSASANKRILELEEELNEAKEKLEVLEEKNMRCQCDFGIHGNSSAVSSKLSALEEELRSTTDKLQASQAQIDTLQRNLEESIHASQEVGRSDELETEVLANKKEIERLRGEMVSAAQEYQAKIAQRDVAIKEFSLTSEKLLQDKAALKGEVQKLQRVITKVEGELSKVSQEKAHLEARVRGLEEAAYNLNESAAEVLKLQKVIQNMGGQLEKVTREKSSLKDRVIEQEQLRGQLQASTTEIGKLRETVKNLTADLGKVSQEKLQLESRVEDLEQATYSLNDSPVEVVKLQEEIQIMRVELEQVTHEKSLLKDRIVELEQLPDQLKVSTTEVVKLTETVNNLKALSEKVSEDKLLVETRVKELEQVAADLKASLESSSAKFLVEQSSLTAEISDLSETNASLEAKLASMDSELKHLNSERMEASLASEQQISELKDTLADLNMKLQILSSEKVALEEQVSTLTNDVKGRDDKVDQMQGHLNHLHLEHVKLITEVDAARKGVGELRARVKKLEGEVEKQQVIISDNAEGKREAINQLCNSLEHYRVSYKELRQLLRGHKRPAMVMAT